MSTRGWKKQTAASRVPPTAVVSAENLVSEILKLVTPVRRTTRSSSKMETHAVPAQEPEKVPVDPKVKKKVSVKRRPVTSDDERCEDAEDPEVESESDDESKLELERLRTRFAELESDRVTHESKKNSKVSQKSTSGFHHELSPPMKPMNPVEGEMLGTFNGKTDLDTSLIRFKTCSRNFKWSETEKVFYLMNALTESAESLVKEVGSEGTLEDIMRLLQSRFGNRCQLEKFRTELKSQRRGPGESLQEFY